MRKIVVLFVLLFSSFTPAKNVTTRSGKEYHPPPSSKDENENLSLNELSCKSASGSQVPWWVIIKLPDSVDDYVYRDANSPACGEHEQCWGTLLHNLSNPLNGALSQTLQQIYAPESQKPAFIMYNDETAKKSSTASHGDRAHAKGVLATDDKGGFWLIHSIPKFPEELVGKEPYAGISPNGRVYGQILLCLSLDISQLKTVSEQLRLAFPFIYQKDSLTDAVVEKLGPDMRDLLLDIEIPESRIEQAQAKTINTSAGSSWLSFSKSRYWENDLYDALVAPKFEAPLLVNAWTNGPGTLPTACAQTSCRTRRFPNRRTVCSKACLEDPNQCIYQYDVANIRQLHIEGIANWPNEKEHSKWAITALSSSLKEVCIGDINRQNGQRYRGGGTVCLSDNNLWQAFYNLIDGADQCMALNHLDHLNAGNANLPSEIED